MEPERETSLPARSSLWLLALLGSLASYVTAIYLSIKSKQVQNNAQHQTKAACNPQSPKQSIHIPSPITISVPDGIVAHQSASDKKDESDYQGHSLFWQKATFWAVFIYAGISGCQLKVSRDAFFAANRPYIGVGGIGVNFIGKDASGKVFNSPTPTTDSTNFRFQVNTKNFGPVPGLNFHQDTKAFVSGRAIPVQKIPDKPYTLFPTEVVSNAGVIGDPHDFAALLNGEEVLSVVVTIEYDGPEGHYTECQKRQYDRLNNVFIILGPFCTN